MLTQKLLLIKQHKSNLRDKKFLLIVHSLRTVPSNLKVFLRGLLRVSFFWENPKTDLWSQINGFFSVKKSAKSENGNIFHDNANKQTQSWVQFQKQKKL